MRDGTRVRSTLDEGEREITERSAPDDVLLGAASQAHCRVIETSTPNGNPSVNALEMSGAKPPASGPATGRPPSAGVQRRRPVLGACRSISVPQSSPTLGWIPATLRGLRCVRTSSSTSVRAAMPCVGAGLSSRPRSDGFCSTIPTCPESRTSGPEGVPGSKGPSGPRVRRIVGQGTSR